MFSDDIDSFMNDFGDFGVFFEEERKIMASPGLERAQQFSGKIAEQHETVATIRTSDEVMVELRRPKKLKINKGNSKSEEQDREWHQIYLDQEYSHLNFSISQATRLEKESPFLWNSLFCTLKYHFFVSVSNFKGSVPFLMAKPRIVQAKAPFKPVLVDYKGNPSLVGDVHEQPLVRHPNDHSKLTSKSSLKMGSLSYRQDESEFCLEFQIYPGTGSTQRPPIALFRSDPVKIYARKPNKPRKKKKASTRVLAKRKRMAGTMPNEPPTKRLKEEPPCPLNVFAKKLDELVKLRNEMKSKTRRDEANAMFDQFVCMLES